MKRIVAIMISLSFCITVYSQVKVTSQELPHLKISELVAKGSFKTNEFGQKADWLRIENLSADTINLSDYKIYISDNAKRLKKFRLKKKTILPYSSMIVWCDDEARTKEQIHANFKLSSFGEFVMLSIKSDSGIQIIDQVYYHSIDDKHENSLKRTESNLLVSE